MNYPNLPNSALEITSQPEVKEITNELLKQLQNALKRNTLFSEQVELSLKGIVRILEVLLSLDFFKNANEIDSSLRNSIEWLNNAGESLKVKMKEYESFFNDFNTSMKANEQEVTATLNANTENIRSEVKKLEKQIIETATKLLTSYQIFLNNAKENATTQITENKTQAINNITEAKKTAFNELLETLKPKFSGLFVGVYYIKNYIHVNSGWEQKIKDLSDYALEENKKYEIEVFFSFVTSIKLNDASCFALKTDKGFLRESIEKIKHKYYNQIYYKKLLVENASGVLSLYHGYFIGYINFDDKEIVTKIREIPNDTIISYVFTGSNFSNVERFVQNLN
ncbi:DUF1542 domain-containing protein [Helicobacter pylori]|uniref:DUF1542 domain-containing protein n=1 Tax=Helicobacter pylori TaxID=210 RepID=UPI001E2B1E44|nr:DUF1542 domain-containing protein [Helicobacter pylori]